MAIHRLRITGGYHRSRWITWQDPRIRPTPCMMRERLFNWLQDRIEAANCLDLFSGSGALGIEALSRGAKHCTFIDERRSIITEINKNLDSLTIDPQHYALHAISWPNPLTLPEDPHLIFCDPPYRATHYDALLHDLSQRFPNSWVYLEHDKKPPEIPTTWQIKRSAHCGQCHASLLVPC